MLNNLIRFPKINEEIKFDIHQPYAVNEIATHIRALAGEARKSGRQVIVLCIGTDRSTGDALGPLTGSKLHSIKMYPHVFGTLDNPVHATNLTEKIEIIQASFIKPFIIAVDACLGKIENVGCVSLGLGPVKPGAAVKKDLPAVGDAYITGIVNVGGFMEHLVLQSTRLNLVIKMADAIAYGVSFGLKD
jgi:putative sporulation protein YyaC